MGSRDQVRRLSDAGAHRWTEYSAADAQEFRLDGALSQHRDSAQGTAGSAQRCSMGRSWSRMQTAFPVSTIWQADLKAGRQDRFHYHVFDLLHCDGYDLTQAALVDRKGLLQQVAQPPIRRFCNTVQRASGTGRAYNVRARMPAWARRHCVQAEGSALTGRGAVSTG